MYVLEWDVNLSKANYLFVLILTTYHFHIDSTLGILRPMCTDTYSWHKEQIEFIKRYYLYSATIFKRIHATWQSYMKLRSLNSG